MRLAPRAAKIGRFAAVKNRLWGQWIRVVLGSEVAVIAIERKGARRNKGPRTAIYLDLEVAAIITGFGSEPVVKGQPQ